jgi:FKBP-type peptidyl-prolyl cis-trans isomerase
MSKKQLQTGVGVVAALAVLALFFIVMNPFNTMQSSASQPADQTGSTTASASGQPDQLIVQDETVGTGAVAEPGDLVSVNYTGKFQDGTVFDTSVGKSPIQFPLGQGYVIPGWDQGLVGMKVGGKRLLVIPPSLGYGSTVHGSIPANSTLIFEVELVGVQAASTTAPTSAN